MRDEVHGRMRHNLQLFGRSPLVVAVLSACAVGLVPGGCSSPSPDQSNSDTTRANVLAADAEAFDSSVEDGATSDPGNACGCRCDDDDDDDDDDDKVDGGDAGDAGKGKKDKNKDKDDDKKKKNGKDCADAGDAGKPAKPPKCKADAGATCCGDAGKKPKKD